MIQRSQFIFMLLLIFVGSRAMAQTPPPKDFQQWTNVSASWRVKPKLEITSFAEVHIGKDVSKFDEELVSAGITYSPRSWVSVGTGYLYLHANPNISGINHENRFYTEVEFNAPAFHGFLISDRFRPELRWEQAPAGASFTQRYRNRVTVEHPFKKYSPFVMWEKFYYSSVHAWSRTRYYAGITVPVAEKQSIQFYYLRQDDRASPPFHKNVVGASLMFTFGGARRSHPKE
jgi:hypothetical protein